jgi:hypothetical protein
MEMQHRMETQQRIESQHKMGTQHRVETAAKTAVALLTARMENKMDWATSMETRRMEIQMGIMTVPVTEPVTVAAKTNRNM